MLCLVLFFAGRSPSSPPHCKRFHNFTKPPAPKLCEIPKIADFTELLLTLHRNLIKIEAYEPKKGISAFRGDSIRRSGKASRT